MPANWTELRDNWNIWAKRQELDSVPALIPDCDCAPLGSVDSSTPCKESAAGAQHRMRNRRESEIHQVQLEAILEGRENVETPALASRKTNQRNSQMPKAASKRRRSPPKRRRSPSKRLRSPSVPSRKSPRLGKQNEGSANLEGNGCQENDTAGCTENVQGSSFACIQCQYTAVKKSHLERHLGSKTHHNKVASKVVASAPAVVNSGCLSKETVSQEEEDLAAEGPVDTSTPSGAQHRMRHGRGSEIHQVQLEAILEGRENVEKPGSATRKTNEGNSQMPRAASMRRRSPSVPSRKSPRLGMQNGGSALLEGNGCKENDTAGSRKQGKQGSKGSKGARAGAKARARARAREEGSFACTQCQFTAASRWHFERHQKTHQKKVASEVVASAVIDSGCPSKETLSQEENDMGAQPTSNNRMNTSRASAVMARTRCAKIAEEEEE